MRHHLAHKQHSSWRHSRGGHGLGFNSVSPALVLVYGLASLGLLAWGRSLQEALALAAILLLLFSGVPLAVLAMVRARARRGHYQSGDSNRVDAAVNQELSSGMSPQPLRALALAGLGNFRAARRALLQSPAAQEEDQELRLCANIVIAVFEGQQSTALGLCRALLAVPLCGSVGQVARRDARREAMVALVRVTTGAADETDYQALHRASTMEPSLYWAYRYGAAVACCVKAEPQLASRLLKGAPPWPPESIFRSLHSRILAECLDRTQTRQAV